MLHVSLATLHVVAREFMMESFEKGVSVDDASLINDG